MEPHQRGVLHLTRMWGHSWRTEAPSHRLMVHTSLRGWVPTCAHMTISQRAYGNRFLGSTSLSLWLGWGLRVCTSNKLPADDAVAGPALRTIAQCISKSYGKLSRRLFLLLKKKMNQGRKNRLDRVQRWKKKFAKKWQMPSNSAAEFRCTLYLTFW